MIGSKDILLMTLLFAGILALCLSQLNKPVLSDPVGYARIAESIVRDNSYSIDSKPESFRPPVFPLSIAPWILAFGNTLWALRISAGIGLALLVCLTYLIGIFLLKDRTRSFLAALLVGLNPWVVYYTVLLPFSESVGSFLFLLGVFFLFIVRSSRMARLLGAALLGVSVLARTAFLIVAGPLVFYTLFTDLKKRRYLSAAIIVIVFLLPFGIWSVRNMSISSENVYLSSAQERWMHAPGAAAKLILIAMPLTFMFIIPLLIFNLNWRDKLRQIRSAVAYLDAGKLSFDTVILMTLFIYTLFLSFLTYTDAGVFTWSIGRTRLFIPFLPLLTVFSLMPPVEGKMGAKKIRVRQGSHSLLKLACILILVVYMLASLVFLTGFSIGSEERYFNRAEYRQKAAEWINRNAPIGSKIFVRFYEPEMVDVNTLNEHLFRDDLIILGYDHDYMVSGSGTCCENCSAADYILVEGMELSNPFNNNVSMPEKIANFSGIGIWANVHITGKS